MLDTFSPTAGLDPAPPLASCEDRADPDGWDDPDLVEVAWEQPPEIAPAPPGSSFDAVG